MTMLNNSTYSKVIPPFYLELLQQINRVEVCGSGTVSPHSFVHFQPSKEAIRFHTGSVIKLSHEISHAVEMSNPERLTQPDFGMRTYYPRTTKGQLQAIARESRAKGIQTRLVQCCYGYKNYLFHRTAGDYMRDFTSCRFSNAKEVKQWSDAIVVSSHKEWTEDKIREAFKPKAEHLNHWLDTAGEVEIDTTMITNRYKRDAEAAGV